MMEIRLHGALAREFGMVWKLDVSSVREAIAAISAMKPGFRAAIMKLDRAGLFFRVRTKENDLGEDDLRINLADQRVDIIPVVRGAGATARIIAGVVLIVVGAILYEYGGEELVELGVGLMSMGVSLAAGGIAQLLAKPPKKADFDQTKSWTINGPLNTTNQGQPIPVIYGEVLTGGIPISAGVTTTRPVVADTTEASGQIGGNFDVIVVEGGPVAGGQVVMHFSVSGTNIMDISHYNWSFGGTTHASSAVITSGQNTASVQVTLTYTIPSATVTYDNFNVQCSVVGRNVVNNEESGAAFTASQTGSLTIDTRVVNHD